MRFPIVVSNRRFRQSRLLVVGCGDVGKRAVRQLAGRMRVVVLTSSPEKRAGLRELGSSVGAEAGVRVLVGDLDAPASLRRLAGLADRVLHAAPPARVALDSQRHRTKHVLDALARGNSNVRLAYISTTGVYGNHNGGWVDETTTVKPESERAKRRVRAERTLRRYGRRGGYGLKASRFKSFILRAPGIYAADRAHTAKVRLQQGTPALRAEDDVFTNRIHADDLARACVLALFRGKPQRVYNVCDGAEIKAGDYLEQVAALYGLPAPERVSKAEMAQRVSPMSMSFLSESRRIRNQRLQELGLQLRYPHPLDELRALVRASK